MKETRERRPPRDGPRAESPGERGPPTRPDSKRARHVTCNEMNNKTYMLAVNWYLDCLQVERNGLGTISSWDYFQPFLTISKCTHCKLKIFKRIFHDENSLVTKFCEGLITMFFD